MPNNAHSQVVPPIDPVNQDIWVETKTADGKVNLYALNLYIHFIIAYVL